MVNKNINILDFKLYITLAFYRSITHIINLKIWKYLILNIIIGNNFTLEIKGKLYFSLYYFTGI